MIRFFGFGIVPGPENILTLDCRPRGGEEPLMLSGYQPDRRDRNVEEMQCRKAQVMRTA
jgi:hypothetical protein